MDFIKVTQEFVDAAKLLAKKLPDNSLVTFLADQKVGTYFVFNAPEGFMEETE